MHFSCFNISRKIIVGFPNEFKLWVFHSNIFVNRRERLEMRFRLFLHLTCHVKHLANSIFGGELKRQLSKFYQSLRDVLLMNFLNFNREVVMVKLERVLILFRGYFTVNEHLHESFFALTYHSISPLGEFIPIMYVNLRNYYFWLLYRCKSTCHFYLSRNVSFSSKHVSMH